MRRTVCALFAAALFFLGLFPAAQTGAEEKPLPEGGGICRCLAAGMDRFVTETGTAPCSANNAAIMTALFSDFLPEGTRVTRRVNGPGSREEMHGLIREVFRDAGEADTSFLYISTHGVLLEEGGTTRPALVLSDGLREETLSPEELKAWMDEIPGKKVLILDCCHAEAVTKAFTGPEWRTLASCRAEEDSYFWAAGEDTGAGYFTVALENALRASLAERLDPDGSGSVSLKELAGRIREIYQVSTAVFSPEGEETPLLTLPEKRKGSERLQDFVFETPEITETELTMKFRFRTDAAVKLEYRLIPMGRNGWEFERALKITDRERTGQVRGMLSPGTKERTVRVSRQRLGDTGKALLQVISWRGLYGQIPVPEATFAVNSNP